MLSWSNGTDKIAQGTLWDLSGFQGLIHKRYTYLLPWLKFTQHSFLPPTFSVQSLNLERTIIIAKYFEHIFQDEKIEEYWLKSVWSINASWRIVSLSTLVQVMACCLTPQSHPEPMLTYHLRTMTGISKLTNSRISTFNWYITVHF